MPVTGSITSNCTSPPALLKSSAASFCKFLRDLVVENGWYIVFPQPRVLHLEGHQVESSSRELLLKTFPNVMPQNHQIYLISFKPSFESVHSPQLLWMREKDIKYLIWGFFCPFSRTMQAIRKTVENVHINKRGESNYSVKINERERRVCSTCSGKGKRFRSKSSNYFPSLVAAHMNLP